MGPHKRAVLVSVKPRFADAILSGAKRVEFRRVWCKAEVEFLLLYSTAPVQRLVGLARVQRVVETDFDGLWDLAMKYGAGISASELKKYIGDKKTAFGIVIRSVEVPLNALKPSEVFVEFWPPMSYRYLAPHELTVAHAKLFPDRSGL